MSNPPPRLWLKVALAANPTLARRFTGLLGERRLMRIGQRGAITAAKRAYTSVPFYHDLYERHGFTAARMRHLTWEAFQQLPTASKTATVGYTDQQLLDQQRNMPAADVVLGRSSGTTGKAILWPTGWDEYYLARAFLRSELKAIGAREHRTAMVLMMPIEGGDLSGNLIMRLMFAIKDATRWPFEVFPIGEEIATAIDLFHWLIRNGFERLLLYSFPGTIERLMDSQDQGDPERTIPWDKFTQKRILLSGQLVARQLRQRVQRTFGIGPSEFGAIQVALGSSDTGQLLAQTTPFTNWLEEVINERPEVAAALGIAPEDTGKSLMQFVPPLSVFVENHPVHGLILTTWKHRPLVRYLSNDLAWIRGANDLLHLLDTSYPAWRKASRAAGLAPKYVPKGTFIGQILGRADEVAIINGANLTPDILRESLAMAGILPALHHFKHGDDPAHPNVYLIAMELNGAATEEECQRQATAWKDRVLAALIEHPGSTDLAAAHRANPIALELWVYARGSGPFSDDAQHSKTTYRWRRALGEAGR